MATSTIKLYHTGSSPAVKWLLQPNKFFVIDNISDYLATFSSNNVITLTNVQYQKCTLELSIVLDLSQTYTEPLIPNGIKYVSIQNSDAFKKYYYYVKSAEWRGKQSVKLHLVMDVANTFRAGTDFVFTNRTKIIREHKNRISTIFGQRVSINGTKIASIGTEPITDDPIRLSIDGDTYDGYIESITAGGYVFVFNTDEIALSVYNAINSLSTPRDIFIINRAVAGSINYHITSYSWDKKYLRNIDLQSEGLTPILYKKEQNLINRSGILNCDWFLLYRNQNDPTEALVNPVECYLIPSEEVDVNMGSIQSGGRINPDNLQSGLYYYIPLSVFQNLTITLSNGVSITNSGDTNPFVIVQKSGDDKIVVYLVNWRAISGINTQVITNSYVVDYFNLGSLPCLYKTSASFITYNYPAYVADSFDLSWTSAGTSPLTLDSVDKVDRTDAKNIKLIKLPYIPYDFEVVSNKLVLTDTDFEHVSLTQSGGGIIEVLKLKNLDVKFNYNFNIGFSPFSPLMFNYTQPSVDDLRDNKFESKIFHSDYYQPKLAYDSFGYVFQLERLDLTSYTINANRNNMSIKYVVSTTINSKFMFQFPEFVSYCGKEDYDNVMPIARNNEIVLYNVPYINYIRSGYNYDVKNKSTQTISSWASVGLGLASTGAALLFPTAPLKVAGVVASLVSTAMSVKNAVISQVQAERNLDEKMIAAKNQSTAVSGSDDVDLMSVYTGNRLKYCLYDVSEITQNLLYDLFFYTGYVSNKMGVPNTNTRVSFNYLEADIDITDYKNMSDEILNELIGLYKQGLTFIHKVPSRTTDVWDLELKYENYEVSLLS